MNVYLTYDYELYFGAKTGDINSCIIKPTHLLLNVANTYNCKITLFVDAGYLYKLKHTPLCNNDYLLISQQLQKAESDGHSIQLHIHPHWEDCVYKNGAWQMNTKRYKLIDFSQTEANEIVKKYHNALQEIIKNKITAYRAGGWCIQPFNYVSQTFIDLGITCDSSVFGGGVNKIAPYEYDFSLAPNTLKYNFTVDECKPVNNGLFTEYALVPNYYSPIFYFKLFALGKLFPSKHKPIGKGEPIINSKGFIKKILLSGYQFCICSDGFYMNVVPSLLKKLRAKQEQDIVIIGHPKAQTLYSIAKTKDLLKKHANIYNFIGIR